ncbi:MAG: endonuclease/exonuclease/phosphatase family protein [Actinomycetia bacterium]|nr:endonuclease/exonuclease/phosphatase family protein [Actinomycetes bacterium]
MRIATWNLNSVKRRVDHLTRWLAATEPDVLCIQETKCKGEDFPELPGLGYEVAAIGDGAWNGVAILSRVGLQEVTPQLVEPPTWEGKLEPRAIGATCGGLRIWSLYIPNGRTPEHEHYQYKLQWLAALAQTSKVEQRQHAHLALLGDFNVAPSDADVYDRAAFEGSTHVTAPERAGLTDLEATGLQEIPPRPLKYDHAFTFWDYRQLAFPKNRGMRIDLAYATPAVAASVTDAYSDRNARKGKGTSDHAPVVIDLDLPQDSALE